MTAQSKAIRGKLNAADLTDEEITTCLAALPRYADLATARLSHTNSLRALAKQNYGSANAVHRNAIRNLKEHIRRCGLLESESNRSSGDGGRLTPQDLEAMSLAEVRDRFGGTPEVRQFLRNWKNGFVIDVDQLYSR